MLLIREPTFVAFGDSLSDVARYLETTPRQWSLRHSETNAPREGWDFSAGYDGAVRLARQGWQEGARRMEHGLRAMPPAVTHHAELRHSVAGHYADVPRFLSGMPDNMVTRGKRKAPKPIAHIVINGTCGGGTPASAYANYGLAIAALVDKLEAGGRRVELDVVFANSFKGKGFGVFGWKVKSAHDHLDLNNVAFSIGHPAAYRRFGFALWERTPARWADPGYGSCADIGPHQAALIGAEGALLFNGIGEAINSCGTPTEALEFVVNKTNRLAGEEIVTLD